MKAVCVVCEANVTVPDDCCEGELVICPDCGTELEVVSLEPLTLEEAPQVQEDWGRIMAVLRILFTRLRTEEKLLKEAAERLGIPCELQLVSDTAFGGEPFCSQDDVVLARCVSHNQNEAVAQMLETQGIRVVNSSHVMGVCGNKLTTSCVLEQAGVPQPKYLVAFTQEGALDRRRASRLSRGLQARLRELGPVCSRSSTTGRARRPSSNTRRCSARFTTPSTFRSSVDKGSFDVRAFVVDGEPLCAIARSSQHWITNTARGGSASNMPLDDEVSELLRSVHRAIGGEFLAVDLFKRGDQWLVNEVNDGGEFRNSIAPTGKDIPGRGGRGGVEQEKIKMNFYAARTTLIKRGKCKRIKRSLGGTRIFAGGF